MAEKKGFFSYYQRILKRFQLKIKYSNNLHQIFGLILFFLNLYNNKRIMHYVSRHTIHVTFPANITINLLSLCAPSITVLLQAAVDDLLSLNLRIFRSRPQKPFKWIISNVNIFVWYLSKEAMPSVHVSFCYTLYETETYKLYLQWEKETKFANCI